MPMQLSQQQIAEAFSCGNFDLAYPYLADDAYWNILGEQVLKGKENIIQFSTQTAKYFAEVTTEFTLNNIVSGDHKIAIDGTAIFINKNNKKTFVSSCDIYCFVNKKLTEIYSYCITTSKEEG